jgi:hypothetical protein
VQIKSYETVGEVWRRPWHVLYRARRLDDRRVVLLKVPVSARSSCYPLFFESARFAATSETSS